MTPLRVLVVDDSAFARKVVRELLEAMPGVEVVGIARDGVDALEKIAELKPDVVTLDLVMPNLDGVGVLQALPTGQDRPAVLVVSIADEDGELGVAALAAGAFDVVKKPTALATQSLYGLGDDLRTKLLAAATWRRSPAAELSPHAPATVAGARATQSELLVIGASTGGPQALTHLLRALPAGFPLPIALVIHMPAGYTEAFARRLDGECALDTIEAREGLTLEPGRVIVARAGTHLKLVRQAPTSPVTTQLDLSPTSALHRPSVDALFESAAASVGAGVLAVVLTGMGNDGTAGARAVRAAGGRVLTESESSCVVYGMPRAVVEAGLSTASAPLMEMAALIVNSL